MVASTDSVVVLKGGVFKSNNSTDGGVAYVDLKAKLYIEGGTFTLNVASDGGGAFFVKDTGTIQVRQGVE